MGGIRHSLDHVRRLKAQLKGGAFIVVDEAGERHDLTQQDFYANFMCNAERLRAHYHGGEVPPPHPVGEALANATNSLPRVLETAAENQRRLDRQLEGESKQ
jgi:hypothetical protein